MGSGGGTISPLPHAASNQLNTKQPIKMDRSRIISSLPLRRSPAEPGSRYKMALRKVRILKAIRLFPIIGQPLHLTGFILFHRHLWQRFGFVEAEVLLALIQVNHNRITGGELAREQTDG